MTLLNKIRLTIITTLITPLILVQSASASSFTKLDCKAMLPKAKVEILLISDRNAGQVMEMTFKNLSIKKPFKGSFNLSIYNSDSDFVASGVLSNGQNFEDMVDVVIQGSLQEDSNGEIHFSMSAGWDHRIEYGYSNFVTCRKV